MHKTFRELAKFESFDDYADPYLPYCCQGSGWNLDRYHIRCVFARVTGLVKKMIKGKSVLEIQECELDLIGPG